MPNGHRVSFRLALCNDPPSPMHSSDSEDTWMDKLRWHFIVKKVLRRWRRLVRQGRVRRTALSLRRQRVLPASIPEMIILRISAFL